MLVCLMSPTTCAHELFIPVVTKTMRRNRQTLAKAPSGYDEINWERATEPSNQALDVRGSRSPEAYRAGPIGPSGTLENPNH